MLTVLDNQIIDRVFQPVLNRLPLTIDGVCRFCLVGILLLDLHGISLQAQAGHWVDITARLIGLGFVCAMYNQSRNGRGRGCHANPYRSQPVFVMMRCFATSMGMIECWLLVVQPTLLHASDVLLSVANVAFWYFVACAEPPPKELHGRLRAFAGI